MSQPIFLRNSLIGRKIETVGEVPNRYGEVRLFPWVRKDAMAKGIDGLVANGTFTVSELPPGRKAIQGRWVFQWKCSEHGEETRAKCRLGAATLEGVESGLC